MRCGAQPPQFSPLLRRPVDLDGRHLDAVRRTILAGLSVDRLGSPVRVGWIRIANPGLLVCPVGRRLPIATAGIAWSLPPSLRRCSWRRFSRHHLGGNRGSVAHIRAGLTTGPGQCLRHSRTSGFRGGNGGPPRSGRSDCPEQLDRQRCAHYRPIDCRNRRGGVRRRLVLFDQRSQLYRRRRGTRFDDRCTPRAHPDPRSAIQNIVEGFAFAWRTGPIRALLLCSA